MKWSISYLRMTEAWGLFKLNSIIHNNSITIIVDVDLIVMNTAP